MKATKRAKKELAKRAKQNFHYFMATPDCYAVANSRGQCIEMLRRALKIEDMTEEERAEQGIILFLKVPDRTLKDISRDTYKLAGMVPQYPNVQFINGDRKYFEEFKFERMERLRELREEKIKLLEANKINTDQNIPTQEVLINPTENSEDKS